MIEIFKNANYDFIGKSKFFIALSIAICVVGIGCFFLKGFNLGIDFAGGTLVNVRFRKPVDDSRLRTALSKRGIDSSKVVIQPVASQIGEVPRNEVLIRMPQTFSDEKVAGGIDTDKRAIIEALSVNYSEVTAEQRAGKLDVNNVGRDTIREKLLEIDPLKYRSSLGEASARQEYEKLATAVVDYRDKVKGGLIGDVSEVSSLSGLSQLGDFFKANFYAGDFSVVNAEVVGPQVGRELRNRAIYVTVAALAGMLVFIAFRFEWVYGVAAVLATAHDVIVTLAFFSIFGWEISLNVIAALLTLIGYSMNDTIVIFDRIREMLKLRKRDPIEKISNDAINQTLSRTIITSGLTFFSVLALVLFGGPVLRGFSLTLFIGVIVGTYSSIAIATPFMLWWKRFYAAREVAKSAALDKQPTKPAKAKAKA
ncbi:MAG: protein translocase subunit SecF [Acidobacteriota bacterium]|nr:protein translocase subunit SecF [Blastocatellia bacterium]MDW8412875.1 protein translocase subunit SecF [Acidobacteriota bacterium]